MGQIKNTRVLAMYTSEGSRTSQFHKMEWYLKYEWVQFHKCFQTNGSCQVPRSTKTFQICIAKCWTGKNKSIFLIFCKIQPLKYSAYQRLFFVQIYKLFNEKLFVERVLNVQQLAAAPETSNYHWSHCF